MQAETNKNVSWIKSRWFWLAYVILLVAFRAFLVLFFPKFPGHDAWEWTALNVVHGVISFMALHWVRGSPIWEDQGEYIEATAWEQLDNGVPWTRAKKFLIILPIVLFIVTANAVMGSTLHLVLNLAVMLVLIAAKLPELHGVRLFGVNAAHLE